MHCTATIVHLNGLIWAFEKQALVNAALLAAPLFLSVQLMQ